jgi:hypothetical protein
MNFQLWKQVSMIAKKVFSIPNQPAITPHNWAANPKLVDVVFAPILPGCKCQGSAA